MRSVRSVMSMRSIRWFRSFDFQMTLHQAIVSAIFGLAVIFFIVVIGDFAVQKPEHVHGRVVQHEYVESRKSGDTVYPARHILHLQVDDNQYVAYEVKEQVYWQADDGEYITLGCYRGGISKTVYCQWANRLP